MSRGGVVEQDVVSYLLVNLMSAPFDRSNDIEGILTGAGMLACVSLLRANKKARTKPLCLWSKVTHLSIFSALLYLSYINLVTIPGGGYLHGGEVYKVLCEYYCTIP